MSNLSSKLAQLAETDEMFADPFAEEDDNLALAESLGETKVNPTIRAMVDGLNQDTEKAKANKKKSKKEKLLEKSDAFLERHADEISSVFDGYIGGEAFIDDEDEGLRNTLISMGRKYARDTEVTGEQSEVSKAYAKSEKALSNLLQKINTDIETVEKDLAAMRQNKHRNLVALGDLVSSKGQLYNQARSIIKEQNDITKAKFELNMKIRKEKKEADGAEDGGAATSRAIQQLFSMNRKDMVDSMGGYSAMAGARSDSELEYYEENPDSSIDEDAMIQEKYFSDQNHSEDETDGDKFLKYESRGVEYVLLVDRETGDKQVIAEDRDGNIIPDYPMPSNVDQLHFDCVWQTSTATDDLHRNYKLREM